MVGGSDNQAVGGSEGRTVGQTDGRTVGVEILWPTGRSLIFKLFVADYNFWLPGKYAGFLSN